MSELTRSRSGITALAAAIATYFQVRGFPYEVTVLGWRERWKQTNQGPGGASRIALYPGKEPGGTAGDGGVLTREGRGTFDQRALVQAAKWITMSVWAVDPTNKNDEGAQIAACEDLWELAIRAVHNAVEVTPDPKTGKPVVTAALGFGNVTWGNFRWTKPPVELGFGQELLQEFLHKGPIFDEPIDVAFPQQVVERINA